MCVHIVRRINEEGNDPRTYVDNLSRCLSQTSLVSRFWPSAEVSILARTEDRDSQLTFARYCASCTHVRNTFYVLVSENTRRLLLLSDDVKEHVLDSLKYIYNDKEPKIRDKATELRKKLLSLGS